MRDKTNTEREAVRNKIIKCWIKINQRLAAFLSEQVSRLTLRTQRRLFAALGIIVSVICLSLIIHSINGSNDVSIKSNDGATFPYGKSYDSIANKQPLDPKPTTSNQ